MRVLIGCVGNNEPEGERGKGPLFKIIGRVEAQQLYLLYTEGKRGTRGHMERLVEAVGLPARGFLLTEDVQDWNALHTRVDVVWREVLESLPEGAELHLAMTGAPAIREALVVEALSTPALPIRVWQARDEDEVHEVDLTRRREDLAIRRAVALAQRHLYGLTAQVLQAEVLPTAAPERANRVRDAIHLCNAIDRWDQFRFREAADHLAQVQAADSVADRFRSTMRPALHKLQSGSAPLLDDAVELFLNMRRRFEQELYVDALTRFRRLYEKMLKRVLGVASGDIPTLVERYEATAPTGKGLSVDVSLVPGAPPVNLRDKAKELCALRNKTISAHGDQPVDRETVEIALRTGLHLMAVLCDHPVVAVEQAVAEHPLSNQGPFITWLNEV